MIRERASAAGQTVSRYLLDLALADDPAGEVRAALVAVLGEDRARVVAASIVPSSPERAEAAKAGKEKTGENPRQDRLL